MERPKPVKCENCIFKGKNKEGELQCWRYPPNVLVDINADKRQWQFPLISNNLFCGEFLPYDNLTAIEWIAWKKGLIEDAKVQE
jgi:hypothetical protein